MSEWAQDETSADPPPFTIRLKDIRVRLDDDAPTPPGVPAPPPVNLNIPSLQLARDNLGVINVVKADDNNPSWVDNSQNDKEVSYRQIRSKGIINLSLRIYQ